MRKFFKDWQGAIATAMIVVAFCLVPLVFEILRVTSGVIDWAYLQALVFSTVVFFSAILCAWVAIQCDWKIFSRHIDSGDLANDWHSLPPLARVLILKGVIFLLIFAYILCYFALPKP